MTTHAVSCNPAAASEQLQDLSHGTGTYNRLVSLATLQGEAVVCVCSLPQFGQAHTSPARSLGVLCVHLSQFSSDFARDLIAARVPFGRLLDEHHVERVVQVGRARKAFVRLPHFTSWRVWAGPCSNPVSRAGNVGSSTWPPSSHVHCKRRAPLLRIRWRRRPLPVGPRRAHAAARHRRRCGAL